MQGKQARVRLDALLKWLEAGRLLQEREVKERVGRDYQTARRCLEQTYKDFSPEDTPIDENTVLRDMATARDLCIDEQIDAIGLMHSECKWMLEEIARRFPEVYDGGDAKISRKAPEAKESRRKPVKPKAPEPKPPPVRSNPKPEVEAAPAPAPRKSRPPSAPARVEFEPYLSAPNRSFLVKRILDAKDAGLLFDEIVAGTSAETSSDQREAVRRFVYILRVDDLLRTDGNGKRRRYIAERGLGDLVSDPG